MPVNFLHSVFHRVERGWDPITAAYAEEYDNLSLAQIDTQIVEKLRKLAGGFEGKRVLDLGAGPGHYSVLFAKCGALVTWHDVSREYERIARRRAALNQVTLDFSLGYLEDAEKFGQNHFDAVFSRVSWYYGRNDCSLGRMIYRLLKQGGIGYIDCHTPAFSNPQGIRKLQQWFNDYLWWKIGHPMPPHGRIAALIQSFPVQYVELDYHSAMRDIVTFVKASDDGSSAEFSPHIVKKKSDRTSF